MSDFEPGRWWRVLTPDGEVWCETSDEEEARQEMAPGRVLQREWVRGEPEWRVVDA